MTDYATRHFLRPHTLEAKRERALRLLGDKWCLKQQVKRTEQPERVSLLDRWRAQRHAA
jgi:hypothetical protein